MRTYLLRLLKYPKIESLRAALSDLPAGFLAGVEGWRSNLDFIGLLKRLLRRFAPRNDFFKGLLLLLLFQIVCNSFSAAQQKGKIDISGLHWLTGSWLLDQGIRTGEEVWKPLVNGRMEGKSSMRKNGKITLQESMFIEKDSAGSIVFTALTGDQPAVSFPMVIGTTSKVVFENLNHDFPQRIIYELVTADSLRAMIEGSVNGKIQTVHFPFRKVQTKAD